MLGGFLYLTCIRGCIKVRVLLLVTLVGVAQVAYAEDCLPPVPVTLPAMYFVIVVVMSHPLVNQVSINAITDNYIDFEVILCTLRMVIYNNIIVAVDVLEFVQVPSNVTTILDDGQQQLSQFHCSVRASRVTNFQWRFTAINHGFLSSSIHSDSNSQQISNQVGSLDTRYSVVSSDYSSEFIIANVLFSDAGIYTCIASIGNRVSLIESSAFHTVEGN